MQSLAIGMTGCGNNSSSTPAAVADDTPVSDACRPSCMSEDTCKVPEAATQPTTLDQNNTVATLSAALIAQELGYMLGDGGMYLGPRDENSANKPKEVSKLAIYVKCKSSNTPAKYSRREKNCQCNR